MKKILSVLLIIALLLCFAACGENKSASSEVVESKPAVSSETEKAEKITVFPQGLWGVKPEGSKDDEEVFAVGVYYFSETLKECNYHPLPVVAGIGFDYETVNGEYIFHMGDIQNNTKAQVEFSDAKHATIKWQDGKTEKLVFVADKTFDDLTKENENPQITIK